jgi:hypothetical protein
MKLEYNEVRKTASRPKFRAKAFIDGDLLPEARHKQGGKP